MAMEEKAEAKAMEYQVTDACRVWNGGCPNVRNSAMRMFEWTKEQYEKKLDEAIQLAHEALKGTNSSQHTTDFKGNEWAEKLFNFVSKEL